MSIALYHTDQFVLPLPDGHQFPMDRYRRLRNRLVEQGIIEPQQLHVPAPATRVDLLKVHSEDYVTRVFSGTLTKEEQRRIGFPWTPEMVERSRRSVGATIAASESALQFGAGVNLAGGTHHAFRDRGGGYCVFNDIAVAIRRLQAQQRIHRAIVIDGDVHQGDGTATLFVEDDSVFTFSIHAAKAYPARKQISDLDIPLPPGTSDQHYLDSLRLGLNQCQAPGGFDIAFYLAGADPFAGDRLGGLNVSKAGLRRRDQMVIDFCLKRRFPIVLTMAGGYAEDIDDIVDIQTQTVKTLLDSVAVNSGV